MSWHEMPMRHPGVCIICKESVQVNEIAFWSSVKGVKHQKCEQKEHYIKCAVCGGSAGCTKCEFQENCDIPNVSPLCLCYVCMQQKDAVGVYRKAISKKFTGLAMNLDVPPTDVMINDISNRETTTVTTTATAMTTTAVAAAKDTHNKPTEEKKKKVTQTKLI